MARNKDYTCDNCGVQFDSKTGFVLRLSGMNGCRDLISDKMSARFDLCEPCANKIRSMLREKIGVCDDE